MTHIKAMSLEKFEELNDLLFTNESNIKKLLDMKRTINKVLISAPLQNWYSFLFKKRISRKLLIDWR